MTARHSVPALLLLAACTAAPEARAPAPPAANPLAAGDLLIEVRAGDGTFDVSRGGVLVLQRATADLLFDAGAGPTTLSLSGPCTRRLEEATVRCDGGPLDLALAFTVAPGGDHLTARLTATNRTEAPVTILRLAPIVAEAEGGGRLLLGADPRSHRILENGRSVAFDQTAQLEAGDVGPFPFATAIPIPLRGNSVSNWTQLVADAADPSRSLVAGWLTFERCVPTLGVGFDPALARPLDGRTPFTTWAAENALVFHGKPLAPGASLASELLYLDPLPRDPLEALERYADAVAAEQGIVPWASRGPGHPIPAGWNSWTGGSSTGGLGQDVDEATMHAGLDVIATELLPFGMEWLPLDDGWQVAHGDWRFRADTFPEGGAALAARISAAGLLPGLWIAPFWAEPRSELAAAHEDWLLPVEDGVIGAFGKDREMLDLTNPEVLSFVKETLRGIGADGFRFVKADFTYLDLLGRPQADPGQTNVEAYRAGWRAIREGLGPEPFLLGVGLVAANTGVVDGMRLTLDDGPRWDEDDPADVLASPRSLKGSVRTGSRRWFYGNRVWVNHDDLIFFRSWPAGDGVPPLSLQESRTFVTWIGLGGGIVKIGDTLEELALHPEWIDVLRRVLPVWPHGARPLDLLRREYPERFELPIEAPAGSWTVLGLFDWGTNRDVGATPPVAMAEEPRIHQVTCARRCLVWELWSERFLGSKEGTFEVTVEPREVQLLAIRDELETPQLLGSNRHVTMGATDLGPLTWDATTRTLSGTVRASAGTARAPFEHHLAFHAPTGFTLDEGTVEGVAGVAAQEGELVTLRFSPTPELSGQELPFRLRFR